MTPKTLIFLALTLLACGAAGGCRQDEARANNEAPAEVGFSGDDYVLEFYDVQDLIHEALRPPACLSEIEAALPAVRGADLVGMAKRAAGPAGETRFANFEVHQGILMVTLPPPEQGLVRSLLSGLRREATLFVELEVSELSGADAKQIHPDWPRPRLLLDPVAREQVEALRGSSQPFRTVSAAVGHWCCVPVEGDGEAGHRGLHVRATPSADRRSFRVEHRWSHFAKGAGDVTLPDRAVFLLRLPGGERALSVQPRLVALDRVLARDPIAPRLPVQGEDLSDGSR